MSIEGQVHLCRVKGNLFQNSRYEQRVAVGDAVEVKIDTSQDAGWIYEIKDRKSKISFDHNLRTGLFKGHS